MIFFSCNEIYILLFSQFSFIGARYDSRPPSCQDVASITFIRLIARNKFPAKSFTRVLGVVVSEQFGAIEE